MWWRLYEPNGGTEVTCNLFSTVKRAQILAAGGNNIMQHIYELKILSVISNAADIGICFTEDLLLLFLLQIHLCLPRLTISSCMMVS